MAKYITRTAMSSVKNTVTAVMNQNTASTRLAIVDACSGSNLNPVFIVAPRLSPRPAAATGPVATLAAASRQPSQLPLRGCRLSFRPPRRQQPEPDDRAHGQ